MSSVWLTYSWKDNEHQDVDYVAQELALAGLDLKLDRWNISAGHRLWEQIEQFIQNPQQSDAWIMFATENSLGSQSCREEYAYALDRALRSRDSDYPLIALFPSTVDQGLIPAGIRTRLFVSMTDHDWKERILATVERRPLSLDVQHILPLHVKIHKLPSNAHPRKYAIEIRPRAGTWGYPAVAIPGREKDISDPVLRSAPAGVLPRGGVEIGGENFDESNDLWVMHLGIEITPTFSCYLFVNEMPSEIICGPAHGEKYVLNSLNDG